MAISASCLGIALMGGVLTWRLRMPVLVSWSVPGAALLAGLGQGLSFPLAVGSFAGAALLAVAAGLSPAFVRLAQRLPSGLSAALLAGLLFPFCLGAIQSFQSSLLLAGLGLLAYLAGRRLAPDYALVWVLLALAGYLVFNHQDAAVPVALAQGAVTLTWPQWQPVLLLSLALPLFVISLVAQNLPGIALLRLQGYAPNVRAVLLLTGGASLILAPLGVFGLNLAPVSAAMCMGPEGEGATARRQHAAFAYALVYGALALFSRPLLVLFSGVPKAAVLSATGLALLLPLGNALQRMLQDASHREAALLTFITGASGVALAGIGSSFWALLMGAAVMVSARSKRLS